MSSKDSNADSRTSNMISDDVAKQRRNSENTASQLGIDPDDVNVASEPIREYVAHRSPEWKEKTMGTYVVVLRHFVEFLDKCTDHDVMGATGDDVYQFFLHCAAEQHLRKNTISLRATALRGLYEYYQIHGNPELSRSHIDNAFNNKIKSICPDDIKRTAISREEVELLFENAESNLHRLILQFTYRTGGRNSDICDLKTNRVYIDERKVEFIDSKGGKDYAVPIPNELALKLKQWITTDREAYLDGRESDYLFPGKRASSLHPHKLREIVDTAAQNAGIQEDLGKVKSHHSSDGQMTMKLVTPHTLRHSIITHLAEDDIDVKHRQLLAGHSDPSTTENVYTHDGDTAFEILREQIN
ncbi:tyrosine-type recombinase/integrase [Halosegnis longus]|uniref:tyrosine-type recombinase/integrase n=1 Tax=Halosegnis longus TaxID=2216012 RepID=UPI0009AD6B3F|nr:tyrosine-type recombinase/integrase [Salella cibi]